MQAEAPISPTDDFTSHDAQFRFPRVRVSSSYSNYFVVSVSYNALLSLYNKWYPLHITGICSIIPSISMRISDILDNRLYNPYESVIKRFEEDN